MKQTIHSIFIFLAFIILGACQSTQNINSSAYDNGQIADPIEGWNRHIFAFNNTLDEYFLEPVAIGYDTVTPGAFRYVIRNELDYLQSPVSIVNSALQGDLDVFLHVTGRFFLNTVFGGLGMLDAATSFGLERHQEDFGQTLAVWGVPDGGYYMMPILGPTTLRGLGGRIVDIAFDPTTYLDTNTVEAMIGVRAINVVEFRASNIDMINNLKSSSTDYYAALRTIFIQRRNASIKNATFIPENEKKAEFIDFDEE